MGNPRASELKPGEQIPEVAARWAKALALRMAGANYDQIAAQCGYASRSGAYAAVLAAIKATLREPAEDVRTLEVERLDRLMLGVWQRACGGDSEVIDRVLKIMSRRSSLLGLDAPQKQEITGKDGGPLVVLRLGGDAVMDDI